MVLGAPGRLPGLLSWPGTGINVVVAAPTRRNECEEREWHAWP
jgi:hypothetical protein